jgi:hypothetical protein
MRPPGLQRRKAGPADLESFLLEDALRDVQFNPALVVDEQTHSMSVWS